MQLNTLPPGDPQSPLLLPFWTRNVQKVLKAYNSSRKRNKKLKLGILANSCTWNTMAHSKFIFFEYFAPGMTSSLPHGPITAECL